MIPLFVGLFVGFLLGFIPGHTHGVRSAKQFYSRLLSRGKITTSMLHRWEEEERKEMSPNRTFPEEFIKIRKGFLPDA